jgi:hypothetical protein
MWEECEVMLHELAQKKKRREWLRGVAVTEDNTLILPNGLTLHYNIRYDSVAGHFTCANEDRTLWGRGTDRAYHSSFGGVLFPQCPS